MDGTESKKIAEAWVNFQRNWWAWDKLDELCRKDAKAAWAVLVELVEVADGADLLEDIGVGPLEDFINYYATDYIDDIEAAARASEQLSAALAHAQLRDANHEMAARIAALGCRTSGSADEIGDIDENP
ncbi:MAG: hypothetical protein ACI915_001335 [Gammaproteobacteria bacterium]|jgi:hypothetical protein